LLLSGSCVHRIQDEGIKLHRIRTDSVKEIREFFAWSPDRLPVVCAHRGGSREGYPENCIETFENTLKNVYALIEVDPRYTKDSVMVLMHDPTLDRTTNGKGRVSDYTLEELKKLRLKDPEGNITGYRIPTLDEVLAWAKSKTILILDRKDVPLKDRVRFITEHKAEAYVMVIAYTLDEIKECHRLNPDIMMEVFIPDAKQVSNFEANNVPWANVTGFVSHNLITDTSIFDLIHEKGVKCIVGSSRNHDISYTRGQIKDPEELSEKYRMMILSGADIIEADLAIEAGMAIRDFQKRGKSGSAFLKY
jgi:glycerophosphoryl diester phosphodiesterase